MTLLNYSFYSLSVNRALYLKFLFLSVHGSFDTDGKPLLENRIVHHDDRDTDILKECKNLTSQMIRTEPHKRLKIKEVAQRLRIMLGR